MWATISSTRFKKVTAHNPDCVQDPSRGTLVAILGVEGDKGQSGTVAQSNFLFRSPSFSPRVTLSLWPLPLPPAYVYTHARTLALNANDR
jgi:hypothetical protein